jgi:hypothetical protein
VVYSPVEGERERMLGKKIIDLTCGLSRHAG